MTNLQLTRGINGDFLGGGTGVGAEGLDLLDNVETLGDLTEDNVLAVQPRAWDGGDEELRTVGVRTSVGHGQQTGSVVLLGEVLVSELLTVDGSTTGTVTSGEVTTLQHELRDHSVERAALVAVASLTSTQSSEVLSGLWDNVAVQLERNSSESVAVGGNVKVNLGHGN